MSKTTQVLTGIVLTPVIYFASQLISQRLAIKYPAYANNLIAYHLGKQKAYKFLRDHGRSMTVDEFIKFIEDNMEEIQ